VSISAAQKFKGFLPEPSFVMAKKHTTLLKHEEAVQQKAEAASSLLIEGNANSELVFVIERSSVGSPFAGKAGTLLQKMIEAMGVRHTSILMISLDPSIPHVLSELNAPIAKAKVLVSLGEGITRFILQTESTLGALRGQTHPFDGLKVIPSFHPAELITAPALKKEAWEDLKLAVKELGWTLPPRGV
jgi:uracil-DNA glycosylase